MNENYLHYVWMNKRVPSIQIKLTDNRKIDILNFGYYNRSAAGPDFSMGIIHLEGTDLFGPIELHVKSSDWYKHGHQNDPSYNNVILHVVYEHDEEVIQNGRVLPSLEIASYIDVIHYKNYRLSSDKHILPCRDSIHKHQNELEEMKVEALNQKLMSKVNIFLDQNRNMSAVYYKLLAVSCGSGLNKKAFDELTERYSLNTLMKISKQNRFNFLLDRSGLLGNRGNDNWEFSGFYPAGHPMIRLKQFIHVLNAIDPLNELDFILNCDFSVFKKKLNVIDDPLPLNFIRHIFINTVIPLQFIHGIAHGSDGSNVFPKLKALPSESNRIVRMWKDLGVSIENAYDSQSVIALYNSLCNEKKCLSCGVGNALVKEPNDTEDCIFL